MLLLLLLQELEQEKYHLRRRLEVAEEEYDLKVAELLSDINNLRQMLEVRTDAMVIVIWTVISPVFPDP